MVASYSPVDGYWAFHYECQDPDCCSDTEYFSTLTEAYEEARTWSMPGPHYGRIQRNGVVVWEDGEWLVEGIHPTAIG